MDLSARNSGVRMPLPQGRKINQKYEHNEALVALAQSQNNFTRDMYVKLAEASSGNLFFSPFSIMNALGMALAGASGNTKIEMQQVLHLTQENEIHDAFKDVITDLLTEVPHYKIRIANMAYISERLNVLSEFADILREKYLSSFETVDFNQEATVRQKINGHVEQVTDSLIKDIIPPGLFNDLTRMVLVNAVYFKGRWEHQFDVLDTFKKNFWISATESIKTPLMFIKKRFGYLENEDLGAKMLKMNYKGSRLSMVVILPNERDGLAAVESRLTQVNLLEIENKMMRTEVAVTLPKFKLEESLTLNDLLIAMGMKDLFVFGDADLSGISGTRELFVSNVLHKAFVEVDETGTEAAAATCLVSNALSLPITKPVPTFVADHPFLFYIRDHRSKVLLFSGRLMKP